MEIIEREQLERLVLPGRVIQKAVGKDGAIKSGRMTVGFASYSEESGPMEPHNHAEETVYIVDAFNSWIRYGDDCDNLGDKVFLKQGMVIHFPALEFHVFEYGENGYVDIMYCYGQVDNIRPEEMSARESSEKLTGSEKSVFIENGKSMPAINTFHRTSL